MLDNQRQLDKFYEQLRQITKNIYMYIVIRFMIPDSVFVIGTWCSENSFIILLRKIKIYFIFDLPDKT